MPKSSTNVDGRGIICFDGLKLIYIMYVYTYYKGSLEIPNTNFTN